MELRHMWLDKEHKIVSFHPVGGFEHVSVLGDDHFAVYIMELMNKHFCFQ